MELNKNSRNSVMLSDPDQNWAREISSILQKKGFATSWAETGEDTQKKLDKKSYENILIDVELKNQNFIQLIRHISLAHPGCRVIVTAKDEASLKHYSMQPKDLAKLGAGDFVIKTKGNSFIINALKGIKQSSYWEKLKTKQSNNLEAIQLDDHFFTSIKAADITAQNASVFNIYCKLGTNHYVRVLEKGSYLSNELIRYYIQQRGVRHFYFKTEDRHTYIDYVNRTLAKLSLMKGLYKEKRGLLKSGTEQFIDEVYTTDIRPELLEQGESLCKSFYNTIREDKDLSIYISRVIESDASAKTHLFLTALLTTVVASNLDWVGEKSTEYLVMGSLLHDIGKVNLPTTVQHKRPSLLTEDELEHYKLHPVMGVDLLEGHDFINDPVREIIHQHHEKHDGSGFPRRLAGMKIYPLAKIVSAADDIAHMAVEARKSPLFILGQIYDDKALFRQYDPEVLHAMSSGFGKKRTFTII